MSNLSAPHFTMTLQLPPDAGLTDVASANRALLIATFEKIAAGDLSAITTILHPDVVFREAAGLPYGIDTIGVESALKGMEAMFGSWRELRVDIFECLAGGDMVIAYMDQTSISATTGRTYNGPTAEFFRFKEGKVIEWWPIYWDTHAVRLACGL